MEERRKNARSRCLLGARVVFSARSSTLSCTVKNHSEDGALLMFGEVPCIPDMLELVLDNRKTLMPAEVVWRDGRTVGITFPRDRFMAELRHDAARSRALLADRQPGQPLH
jgi:PilZ domain